MSLLTPDDHDFFCENGYLVIKNAVVPEKLTAVIEAIWSHLGMDRNNPEDWRRPPLKPGGMVELYQAQALWDARQSPRLYQLFSEIWRTEKLWVSIDRVSFKPPQHPAHPEYDHKGFIHWDTNTKELPVHFGVQGVLYLADTDANQGGFQCVPELFRDFAEWVKTQPEDRNAYVPDLTGYTPRPIPGEAGDFVVWNSRLPHGNGHNISSKPRFAQFISMFPAQSQSQERRDERIRQWREHAPPCDSIFPGDPRRIEEREGQTAALTPLGRKLLGIDDWNG